LLHRSAGATRRLQGWKASRNRSDIPFVISIGRGTVSPRDGKQNPREQEANP
jgi:hypothetical protein